MTNNITTITSGLQIFSSKAKIDFAKVEEAARCKFETLVRRWMPDGSLKGREWMPCNPSRNDRNPGSFFIHLDTTSFYDFATGEGGRGVISLYAYIKRINRYQAAKAIVEELGVKND